MACNFADFAKLFIKAEGAVKDAEMRNGELLIPAINQLRYSGHHIAKALLNGDVNDAKNQSELTKAINHCRRAYFDAKEAIMLERFEIADSFFSDFVKSDSLMRHLPQWSEYRIRTQDMKSEITMIREKVYEDRTDMFDKIDPLVDELGDIVSKLEIAGPMIVKSQKESARNFILAVVGIVVGIVSLVLGLFC